MADLENDMDNVESVNILQEQTLNTLEIAVLDNDSDLEGWFVSSFIYK